MATNSNDCLIVGLDTSIDGCGGNDKIISMGFTKNRGTTISGDFSGLQEYDSEKKSDKIKIKDFGHDLIHVKSGEITVGSSFDPNNIVGDLAGRLNLDITHDCVKSIVKFGHDAILVGDYAFAVTSTMNLIGDTENMSLVVTSNHTKTKIKYGDDLLKVGHLTNTSLSGTSAITVLVGDVDGHSETIIGNSHKTNTRFGSDYLKAKSVTDVNLVMFGDADTLNTSILGDNTRYHTNLGMTTFLLAQ